MAAALLWTCNSTLSVTQKLEVMAGPCTSKGRNFPDRARFKKIAILSRNLFPPDDLTAAYTALFGPLVADTRIFFRYRTLSTAGVAGPWYTVSVDVT